MVGATFRHGCMRRTVLHEQLPGRNGMNCCVIAGPCAVPQWRRESRIGFTDNRGVPTERVVSKLPLHPADNKATGDLQYWLLQPMQARIAQVEVLRRQSPGYDARSKTCLS